MMSRHRTPDSSSKHGNSAFAIPSLRSFTPTLSKPSRPSATGLLVPSSAPSSRPPNPQLRIRDMAMKAHRRNRDTREILFGHRGCKKSSSRLACLRLSSCNLDGAAQAMVITERGFRRDFLHDVYETKGSLRRKWGFLIFASCLERNRSRYVGFTIDYIFRLGVLNSALMAFCKHS
ncbi:hypothetical protein EJ02DRAFT_155194 [Clathrospora elynae]|uniref:Uncharacterized protein n=1 Tax=Clathrospora elynae TaxID=706981 RepID=A0A6A5SSY5_9PLEO|nr:hypothetical protein EJ02DRAFT_155194 [Clathrospora elynae]